MLKKSFERKGLKDISTTFLSDLFVKMGSFGALLICSGALEVERYNYLLLIISSTALSVSILSLGVVNSSFRLLASENNKYDAESRMLFMALFSVCLATFAYWLLQFIFGKLDLGPYSVFHEVSLAWYLVIIGEICASLARNLAYIKGKVLKVASINISSVLMLLLCLIGLLWVKEDFEITDYLYLVAAASFFRAGCLLFGARIAETITPKGILDAADIRFSSVFLVHIVGMWGLQHIPSWLALPKVDGLELSYLLWANLVLSALLLIPDAVFKSSSDTIVSLFNFKRSSYATAFRVFSQSLLISSILLFLVVLFMNVVSRYEIANIYFDTQFIGYMLAYLFLHMIYFVVQKILVGIERTRILIFSTYIALVFQVVFLLSADEYSVQIIMAAVLLAKAVQLVLIFLVTLQLYRKHENLLSQ